MFAGQMSQPQTSLNPQPQMLQHRSSSNPTGQMSPPTISSSEAQHSNKLEEDEAEWIDDNAQIQPNLQEDQLRYLETLLRTLNWHQWTTLLSPLNPLPPDAKC